MRILQLRQKVYLFFSDEPDTPVNSSATFTVLRGTFQEKSANENATKIAIREFSTGRMNEPLFYLFI
jgi:hypothetical protein